MQESNNHHSLIADEVLAGLLEAVRALSSVGAETPSAITIGPPADPQHGDYASNVAFLLAKSQKRPPMAIAQDLAARFRGPASARAAAPGFVNFRVHADRLARFLDSMEKPSWLRTDAGAGARVNIEFVSANPTGPLHVGHGRGAVIGDTLARLLDHVGFSVTREYYVNDVGGQITRLGESLLAQARAESGLDAGGYEVSYPVLDEAKAWLARGGSIASREEAAPTLVGEAADFAKGRLLERIMEDLRRLGIVFDIVTYESSLAHRIPALLEGLRATGLLYEADEAEGSSDAVRRADSKAAQHKGSMEGGTFLRTSRFGDETDRIILRANGSPTYFTSDIVYHIDKAERGFTRLINVWGADHGGHVKRLVAALEAATGPGGPGAMLEVVLCQMVRLVRGGVEVKMSKRAGTAIALADLVEEVGRDAVRFFFLLRSPNAQFDFDLDLAVKQSSDNPVYYVQYAYARTRQLLAKGAEHGLEPIGDGVETILTHPAEVAIMRALARLPWSIRSAAFARETHRVPALAMELAQALHQYQTAGKGDASLRIVRPEEPRLSAARLYLVERTGRALKALLEDIMGVSAPERM